MFSESDTASPQRPELPETTDVGADAPPGTVVDLHVEYRGCGLFRVDDTFYGLPAGDGILDRAVEED